MRENSHCVANLLVDPRTGGILHVSLTTGFFCGYTSERLRKMNVADLFLQPITDILKKLEGSDYLKEISLDATLSSGDTCATRAYASLSSGRSDALFLSVFEGRG